MKQMPLSRYSKPFPPKRFARSFSDGTTWAPLGDSPDKGSIVDLHLHLAWPTAALWRSFGEERVLGSSYNGLEQEKNVMLWKIFHSARFTLPCWPPTLQSVYFVIFCVQVVYPHHALWSAICRYR